MRNILLFVTIMFLMIFGSCSGDKAGGKTSELPAISVQINEIEGSDRFGYVTASGKIESKNSADLSTRVMGYVTSLNVKTGQKVSKGQLLVRLNNTDLRAKKAQTDASIAQAMAAYNSAKKDFERFTILFRQQSASQKELDDITAHYEMVKAGLEAAEQMGNEVMAQFPYTNITAPFSGVVTGTFVKEGDMANPGMPLVGIEGSSEFQVMAMVPESEIPYIQNGMQTEVLVKSLDKILQGKVIEVSSSSRSTGGQYLVKIALEEDASVFSGMYVNVVFPVAKQSEAIGSATILIPKSALVAQGQLQGIYTVNQNNTAILRWLRLGKAYGEKVEVLSGLSMGERFIIGADGKLYNGAKVSVR
ncbi:MAG TPA: efflux RND transporter periplasmic adaptor subunit [Arenibacter sp.]|nr:efflux RND transporter periplasmic adaptor subunit [Arenibacter sp.]